MAFTFAAPGGSGWEVVHVKRWLSSTTGVLYVFLGAAPSRMAPQVTSVLRRLEADASKALSAGDARVLARAFGEDYPRLLALPGRGGGRATAAAATATAVRYVHAALPLDASVRVTLQTIARAAFDGADARAVYAWTTAPTAPSASLALPHDTAGRREATAAGEAFWVDRMLSSLYGDVQGSVGRSTLEATLSRWRDGRSSRPSPPASLSSPPITRAHAPSAVSDMGGLGRVTRGLGRDPRDLRHADPFGALDRPDELPPDGGEPPPPPGRPAARSGDDRALLGAYMERLPRSRGFTPTVINAVSAEDLARAARRTKGGKLGDPAAVTRAALRTYFPGLHRGEGDGQAQRGDGLPAAAAAGQDERRALCGVLSSSAPAPSGGGASGDVPLGQGPTYQVLSATSPPQDGPGAGAAAEVIDLDAAFTLLKTSTRVPFVRYFDGASHTFKVNRLALHRHAIDVAWVARHMQEATSTYRPFVLFVTHDAGTAADTYVLLDETGGLSMKHVVGGGPPDRDGGGGGGGGIAEEAAVGMHAANAHVVQPLQVIDGTPRGRFRLFDPHALVNVGQSRTQVARLKTMTRLELPAHVRLPSLDRLVHVLNGDAMRPFFAAAHVATSSATPLVLALFRRVESFDTNVNFLIAATLLGLDEPHLAARLAEVFSTTPLAAAQRMQRLADASRRGAPELRKVTYHLQAHPGRLRAPIVYFEPLPGASGFRVKTEYITDVHQASTALAAAKHAIEVAAGAGNEKASVVVPPFSPPSSASPAEREGRRGGDELRKRGPSLEGGGASPEDDVGLLDALLDEHEDENEYRDEDEYGAVGTLEQPGQSGQSENQERGTEEADSTKAAAGYDLLDRLKRADPQLFGSPSGSRRHAGYATTCQKNRQPVVVTAAELERMDATRPGSYDGTALAVGSSRELAARNRYICPQVWCPRSRVSMTARQYVAAGSTCPLHKQAGEQALLFDHKYWKDGAPHIPVFLKPGKHPRGMCMPCCSLKPLKPETVQKCGLTTSMDTPSTVPSSPASPASLSSPSSPISSDKQKYILGDGPSLEEGRYGLLPAALNAAFNGAQAVEVDGKRKVLRASVCGGREDGTGMFRASTDCFVRKGVRPAQQRFLQCMLGLLPDLGADHGVDTPHALVDLMCARLTPAVFIAMNGGHVARMFMNENEMLDEEGGDASFKRFADWFLGATAYHGVVQGLAPVVELVRARNTAHPLVIREFKVYRAFHRFLAYLRDDGITKTHGLLLDLFNMPLAWLNPRRLNIVVFDVTDAAPPPPPPGAPPLPSPLPLLPRDGSPDVVLGGDRAAAGDPGGPGSDTQGDALPPSVATVECGLPRKFRLASPFAFVSLRGRFYEPIHRVRIKRSSHQGVRDEMHFRYDGSARVRGVVDSMVAACRGGGFPPGGGGHALSLEALLRGVESIAGPEASRLRAQVVDYTFRLVGVITVRDVFVPVTRYEESGPMMVGKGAPPEVMYVGDVARLLRPSPAPAEVRAFFSRLADLTGDGGYAPREDAPDGLVLASGALVPLRPAAAPGRERQRTSDRYLEDLNIMIGRGEQQEARVEYHRAAQSSDKDSRKEVRHVAGRVLEDSRALRELAFLRSTFNPFPLEYRRHKMRALLEGRLRVQSARMDALVEEFLYGPDPLLPRSQMRQSHLKQRHAPRDSAVRADYVFTDLQVLRGEWRTYLEEIVHNPFADPSGRDGPVGRGAAATAGLRGHDSDAIGRALRTSLLTGACGDAAPQARRRGSDAQDSTSSASSASVMLSIGAADTDATGTLRLLLGRSTGSSSGSSTSRRSVRLARRNEDAKVPHLVPGCDVWRTFSVVLRIMGGTGVPISAFRHVLHNALIRDARRLATAPHLAPQLLGVLSSHPSWEAILAPRISAVMTAASKRAGRGRRTGDEAARFPTGRGGSVPDGQRAAAAVLGVVDRLVHAMDRPDYVPGKYDVRVLAAFCRVTCVVYDAETLQKEVVWTEQVVPARGAQPPLPAGGPQPPPALLLVYQPRTHVFDVVTHRSRSGHHSVLLYPEDPTYAADTAP